MLTSESMTAMQGRWTGTNKFRLMPTDGFADSESIAHVRVEAKGHAVTISYSWAEAGVPQEGVLLVSAGQNDDLQAVWVDSWHQNPSWMQLTGRTAESRISTLDGSYDGGAWRIVIETDGVALRLKMFNEVPSMNLDAYIAMDATLTKSV